MKKIFSFLTVLLFAGSMMAANYVKVTAEPTDWSGKYLVVYESSETKAFVFNGNDEVSDYVEATIAEGKISSTSLSDYEVTVASMEGGYSLFVGGKYISGKTNTNGITFGDAAVLNTIEYSTDKSVVTSNSVSLQFNSTSGQTRFRYFKSTQKAIQLYKLDEGGEEEGPTYTVAGSNATILGTSWDPANAANDMTKQEDGTYKWEKTGLELSAGSLQFKVCKDHSWDVSYPGENYELKFDESGVYTVTITFEPENGNKVSAVATKTADLVVLPKVVLHGNFTGSWADTDEFVASEDKKSVSLELTLGEGSFNFGFKFDGSWKANGATIDREHPSTSLAEGTGDMSIVADEAGKYTFVYTFATQALEVTFPAQRITSADVYSAAKGDAVALKDVVVTYVNGKNVYVKDETGAMLLYLPASATWSAGDVLSGVAGVVDIYNGLYEVKPTAEQVAAVVAVSGDAPAPIELTGAPVAADVNKYVILKGVSVSAASFPSNKNMNATIGEETFVLRNNFNANVAFDTEKKYDIIGAVAIYTKNDETTVQLYFISAEEYVAPIVPADRRINAWGLNVVGSGESYTFSYNANIDGNEANLVFFKDGEEVGVIEIDAPKKGANEAVVAKEELPAGKDLTWGVELKANPVTEFGKVFEDTENVLNRAHAVIDNSPESDYMGRIYIENRAGSKAGGVYVYDADYSVNTKNTKCGLPVFRSAGRPAVGADGTLWLADWGDGGTDPGFGIASVDPATLVATKFYDGEQATDGLWTNGGVELGSSCAGVGLYGEGKDMKLFAMNEDGTTLPAHGCLVYNIGQEDGTIVKSWNKAPNAKWTLKDNAAQNLEITPCSHGVFFSCNRSEGQNTSGARALQLVNDGEQIFVGTPGDDGTMPQLTGCAGGGFALTRDEDHAYIVNGSGNILSYNVTWTGDVPTMEYVETFTSTFNAIGTLKLDYAGNLIASAGSAYGTSMRLVVYGVPTENNEILVPAKKALTVSGVATAIEDSFVPVKVEKVIRNGQVLIIKDGKTYNMMGQIVK